MVLPWHVSAKETINDAKEGSLYLDEHIVDNYHSDRWFSGFGGWSQNQVPSTTKSKNDKIDKLLRKWSDPLWKWNHYMYEMHLTATSSA